MNHKRKQSSNRRAGFKFSKPWKANGFATESKDGEKFSDHRRRHWAAQELKRLR
jgi:hypothetical protein